MYQFLYETYDKSKLYESDTKAYGVEYTQRVPKDTWVTTKMKKAQKVFSVLEKSAKIASNVADKLHLITGSGALQDVLKCLGPYGTVIAKGM